jgi:sulfur dioxygenase
MPFREVNHAKCKTYMAISQAHHVAAVIDPVRERIERYLALLAYYGCKLDMIIDTHTHADHRSGAIELGQLRTVNGSRLAISSCACFIRPAIRPTR